MLNSKTVDDLTRPIALVPIETDINFEEKKTTYKEMTENSDASSNNMKSESKKINYDAVETSSKNLRVSQVRCDRLRTLSQHVNFVLFYSKIINQRVQVPVFCLFSQCTKTLDYTE